MAWDASFGVRRHMAEAQQRAQAKQTGKPYERRMTSTEIIQKREYRAGLVKAGIITK